MPHRANSASGAKAKRALDALLHNWPYLLMLALAFIGVAITSVTREATAIYWILLTPVYATIVLYTRWRALPADHCKVDWPLVRSEILHWSAVLTAMQLLFVADMRRIMNSEATSLTILTILALGTFTAGVHVSAWRVSFVGLVLAMAVPLIAWVEEAALLLLILALAGAVLIVIFIVFGGNSDIHAGNGA